MKLIKNILILCRIIIIKTIYGPFKTGKNIELKGLRKNNKEKISGIIFSQNKPFYFLKKKQKYIERIIRPEYFFKKVKNKKIKVFFKQFPNSVSGEREFNMYYLSAKEFFTKNKIEKIILECSYGMKYPFIVAAKEKNIKIIEIQHGIIHKSHPGYIIPKKISENYILPTYLITYGNYEKELLTKHSIWNENQVIPLGCPRYDFLANCKMDKNKLKEKIGIPKDKKILFWPTQTHDRVMTRSGENELNAKNVFKAVKEEKNWFLVIKLHPNENEKQSMQFYKKQAEQNNCKNYKILQYDEIDTFVCINLSNALILKHTTVGMEAILMNRPVINLELTESWDLSQFKELKSALIIKKEKDITTYLNKVLQKEYKKIFEKERKKYIENHFENFGEATKKVAEFIKNV